MDNIRCETTKPSEAYGYIQVVKNDRNNIKKVLSFIENPPKKFASKFVKNDNYYWNAGIFIANRNMIISSINKHAPDMARHCNRVFENAIYKNLTKLRFLAIYFKNTLLQ